MIFNNPEFGQIRTVEVGGEPWLVGKDVAVALGYSNTRDALERHVDAEDKNTVVNPDRKRGHPVLECFRSFKLTGKDKAV